MTTYTLYMPWPPACLSPNSRTDRRRTTADRGRFKRAWWALARAAKFPASDHLCITFHPPTAGRRDLDNMLGSIKYGLDGLALAAGQDDSDWSLTIRRGAPVKNGCVVVTVSEGGKLNKPFDKNGKCVINEARPTGAGNTDEPLDITHLDKETRMPIDGNISANGDSASADEKSTWKSIGELAADALEKRYACYATETIQAIAERKAGEVVSALDSGDLVGAGMAKESLLKFLSEYQDTCTLPETTGGDV